jgi:hypothetical protein
MLGTDGNVGQFPGQVAERLAGQKFSSFDDFRSTFWKTVADDPDLEQQFSPQNLALMQQGLAPRVVESQTYGSQTQYVLHHIQPINDGGGVYNMNDLVIVTPLFHSQILDPTYHYGR